MSTILKVCLAMGGGVSLGSYSGAGLTEALKLLLLYGQNKKGEPYEEIVVDGMSGASAGAISLGILLRCLVDYKSMMEIAGFATPDAILEKINIDYNQPNLAGFSASKKEALYAIEVAQQIQHLIWVKKVTAAGLYGNKAKTGFQQDMNEPFGLLERKSLEALAKKFILPKANFDSSRRALIAPNRVIFALSLTNLAPMPVGYESVGADMQEKNLLRSTASSNHAELRVIDFIFNSNPEKPSDKRWLKFLKNPPEAVDNQMCYDIDQNNAWATLTASTLACGAFPVAFAPVMLKRFKEEYDANVFETTSTGAQKRKTSWPGSLLQIHEILQQQKQNASFTNNSFFAETAQNELDYGAFNFAYIDGGTFNNEPIKEAFKIASFQDFGRDTSAEDRLILFIDPIVRKSEFKSLNISSFAPIKTDIETYETKIKNELSKLFDIIDPLLNTLVDQGSIKEDQKINDVSQRLNLRAILFEYLDAFSIAYDEKLILYAYKSISSFLDKNMISIGTRDGHQYILNAIEKECRAAIAKDDSLAYLASYRTDLSFLFQSKENNTQNILTKTGTPNAQYLNKLSNLKKDTKNPEKAKAYNEVISRAVFKVLADLALGTAGKDPTIDKRVILPLSSDGEKIIDLPGHNVAAFAGFASEKSKEYAFEYARLNAVMTLAIPNKQGIIANETNEAYVPEAIATTLQKKRIERLEHIAFYGPSSAYDSDLKRYLIGPGIDRVFTILKSFSERLKKPKFAFLGILGFLGSLLGFFKQIRNRIKKSAKKQANSLADCTNYKILKPITISIQSNYPISLNRKQRIKIVTTSGDFDLKVYQSSNKKELLFSMYLIKTLETTGNGMKIGLTATNKIQLPKLGLDEKPVDPNLHPKRYIEALQAASPPQLMGLQLNKKGGLISTDFLNNQNQSLYYSLLNAQFHINPMLRYQIDAKAWSFIENTKSFDKEMLETPTA